MSFIFSPLTRLFIPFSLLAAMAVAGLPRSAQAEYQDAAPAVMSSAWQIEYMFEHPTPIAVRNSDGALNWYWYMPYKVVNQTGERQLFVPTATIADDAGRVIEAGVNVPDQVYNQIEQRLENPLLKSPLQVAGPLLEGEDHAEESFFVWPASEKDINEMRVFITGLSGETKTIQNPRTGEPVTLQRTLMLQYKLPGASQTPTQQPLRFMNQDWVLR